MHLHAHVVCRLHLTKQGFELGHSQLFEGPASGRGDVGEATRATPDTQHAFKDCPASPSAVPLHLDVHAAVNHCRSDLVRKVSQTGRCTMTDLSIALSQSSRDGIAPDIHSRRQTFAPGRPSPHLRRQCEHGFPIHCWQFSFVSRGPCPGRQNAWRMQGAYRRSYEAEREGRSSRILLEAALFLLGLVRPVNHCE